MRFGLCCSGGYGKLTWAIRWIMGFEKSNFDLLLWGGVKVTFTVLLSSTYSWPSFSSEWRLGGKRVILPLFDMLPNVSSIFASTKAFTNVFSRGEILVSLKNFPSDSNLF